MSRLTNKKALSLYIANLSIPLWSAISRHSWNRFFWKNYISS